MSRKRRGRSYPKAPKPATGVNGHALCMACFEPVDLALFRTERIAERYPIVHACGRVLMAAP